MRKFRRAVSMLLALATAVSLSPRAAAEELRKIRLPASLEHGSMTVTKNGAALSDGDPVAVGDTLTFTVTPAEGYVQTGGVKSGEKVLTADDFSTFIPVTVDAAANSGWTWTNDYYGHSGYTVVIPQNSAQEIKSFTHTETFPAGEVKISFDWAVNQGYINYGPFKLEFYHNDELKISHDFTETVNPYETILSDTYSFTSGGSGDTFRWDFTKTEFGSWGDDEGRTMYIANIKKSSEEYEYAPETPVFAKTGTLRLPVTEHGRLAVYRENEIDPLPDGASVTVGDRLILRAEPEEGYEPVRGPWEEKIILTDADFDGSVYSPEAPVFEEMYLPIWNDSPLFIDVAETAKFGDTVSISTKEMSGAKITGITVIGKGENILLTQEGEARYSFTMPAADVAVSAQIELDLPTDEGGAYLIGSAEEMTALSATVNNGFDTSGKTYKMTADLSVSTADGFEPIGRSENMFKGTFDGQNHTLTVDLSGWNDVAPFGYAENITIKNLTTAGTIDVSSQYAAGIVEQAWGAELSNCISKVRINASAYGDGTHGGLVAIANGNTTISNCGFTGAINGPNTWSCGGFVGWADGSATVTISNSFVAGSFNLNTASSNDSSYTFSRNPDRVHISNCYYLTALKDVNSGAVQLRADDFQSGKAAWLLNGSTSGGPWKQTPGTDAYPNFTGGTLYQNTCAGNTFYSNTEGTYTSHEYSDGVCVHCGAYKPLPQPSDGVYQIGNAGELFAFADVVNGGENGANAVLTADIDLKGKTWTAIAETGLYYDAYDESDLGYSGTFDGAGHTIKNLALMSSTSRDASCGLFGTVSGTVQNLGVDGVTFVDGGHNIRAGAIVGQLIKTGKILDCYAVNVNITPGGHVMGGIAGCVYEGTVKNCMAYDVSLKGSRYGGIVGDSRGDGGDTDRPGTLENCYTSHKSVSGGQDGLINNCEGGVSAESFKSGEIAYRLNGEQTGLVWTQTAGKDQYPRFKAGDADVTVYQSKCVDNSFYNNTGSETFTEHSYENGICTRCGAYEELHDIVDGVYQINNAGQLFSFAKFVNEGSATSTKPVDAVLTADIDLENRHDRRFCVSVIRQRSRNGAEISEQISGMIP